MSNEFDVYEKNGEEYIYLPFDGISKQTPMAILFDLGDRIQGIPVRHIDMEDFDPEEDACVPVKTWFATNNGLI